MSSNGGQMTIAQYLIFMAPLVVTILVVFGMKYFSAIFQARGDQVNDALYRALAEKAVVGASRKKAASGRDPIRPHALCEQPRERREGSCNRSSSAQSQSCGAAQ